MKDIDLLVAGSWAAFDHLYTVERLPKEGDTVNIITPVHEVDQIYWGGCSYNSGIAAAKVGIRVAALTVEGKDFISRGYKKYLEEHNIELSGVTLLEDERSGHGFLFADPEGNAIVIGNLGSAWRQKNVKPNDEIIALARAVVVAPTFDEFTLDTIKIAKQNNSITAVNGCLTNWPEIAGEFIPYLDIMFGNQFEFQELSELLGLESLYEIFNIGPKSLFITKGGKGSLLVTPESEIHIPAVQAEKFIDPVGAGDAFVGATLAGILLGFNYEIAGRIGATVSSFVVEEKGAQTNLPEWEAIKDRYENFFKESISIRTIAD